MYTVKENILETVALLKEYDISQIVISPGSRNTPIIESFYKDKFFSCHLCVDERNAGFFALGLIQYYKSPVVICCTSGTALLNYAPAVAEAYYQSLPLIVLSADRSSAWINQMDGQTIVQNDAFRNYIKKSVQLPEIKDDTDKWFANRLVNDALIGCTANEKGPVHINIPISEPLFDFSQERLPDVRAIKKIKTQKAIADIDYLKESWSSHKKRMIIVGQMDYSQALTQLLEKLVSDTDCIVLSEHISNINSGSFIHNFDAVLHSIGNNSIESYMPDLVITLGGHIVSKRIKHFLRNNKPRQHWHISESENVVDLFQSLTSIIDIQFEDFFEEFIPTISEDLEKPFSATWLKASSHIVEPSLQYGDIGVVGCFMKKLPQSAQLHLANSSVVRSAQLFTIDPSVRVYCNRGTNGIESILPTAIGFASVSPKPLYVVIGDLSFFYGLNALWNISYISKLRILLINNQGGGIFHLLPNNSGCTSLKEYVAASHTTTAEKWANAAGLEYHQANSLDEYQEKLSLFFDETEDRSIILEVITNTQDNINESKTYYKNISDKK